MIAEPMWAGLPTWKDASDNTMRELAPSRTRGHKWILLHFERCNSHSEAMRREWEIKNDRKFRTTLSATIRTLVW